MKPTTRIHRSPLALSAMVMLLLRVSGHADNFPVQAANFTGLSEQRLAELRQAWDKKSVGDLYRAATDGDPGAEYFYWLRMRDLGWKEESQASQRMFESAAHLTREQKNAAETNWANADAAQRKNAADKGDPGAQMVACELEVSQAIASATNAFPWLVKSADHAFPPAEYDLAINYLELSGWVITPVDHEKGMEYLKRAADHGWAPGQYQLGMFYVTGNFLPPDPLKSLDYLRRAADNGGPHSKYALAQLYAQGIGEPRDANDTPVALLRQSAAKGNGQALQALAERYRNGLGVAKDYIQCIRCYQKALETEAIDGSSTEEEIKNFLQLVDDNGEPKPDVSPVWSDMAHALSLYDKAIRLDNTAAMTQLGRWYLAGQFEPPSQATAYYWFNLAAEAGNPEAELLRAGLRKKLSPAELEQATKEPEFTP